MNTGWDGVGDRMRRNRGRGHAYHPTMLEGTYSLVITVRDHISKLKGHFPFRRQSLRRSQMSPLGA